MFVQLLGSAFTSETWQTAAQAGDGLHVKFPLLRMRPGGFLEVYLWPCVIAHPHTGLQPVLSCRGGCDARWKEGLCVQPGLEVSLARFLSSAGPGPCGVGTEELPEFAEGGVAHGFLGLVVRPLGVRSSRLSGGRPL